MGHIRASLAPMRWWMPRLWPLATIMAALTQVAAALAQPGTPPPAQAPVVSPAPVVPVVTRGFDGRVRIGRPARPTRLRILAGDDGVQLQLGGVRAPLPLSELPVVDVRQVALAGGAQVAVVTMRAGERRAGAIASRPPGHAPELLWVGLLSEQGDPGERRGHLLEVVDADGDGQARVRLSRTLEGVARCGEARTPLRVQEVDAQSLRLRPASVVMQAGGARLDATSQPPAFAEGPGPHLLTPIAVSSANGASDTTGLRLAARALTDGDVAQAWTTEQGLDGTGAFASLRWESKRWPLRALAVTLPPRAAGHATPRRLLLAVDGQLGFDIHLPPASDPQAARTLWVVPPQPLAARCLTLTVAEVEAAPGSAIPVVSIAELRGYSALDGRDAVPALVDQLAAAGGDAAEAAQWLAGLGTPAVVALSARFDALPTSAQRRALSVAAQLIAEPGALELVAKAARSADAQLRQAAVETLVGLGDAARGQRRQLLGHPGAGPALALTLARRGGPTRVDELIEGLQAPDAQVAALRSALSEALAHDAGESVERLAAWSKQTHPAALEAQVALAAANVRAAHGVSAALVARNLRPDNAPDFELTWRLVLAAAALPADAGADAELSRLAAQDTRWMLRDAALQALARRGVPGFEDVARARLLDPYPRVRATAVRGLGALGAAAELLAKHARQDRWFLVRVAAFESLPDSTQARVVMRGGVRDRVPAVRSAAVAALQRVGDREAWTAAVQARVAARDEYPEVISSGITFARELCIKAAGPTLREVAERGLKPDAWDPDRQLAVEAIRALQHLQGGAAVGTLAARAGPGVVQQMQADAEHGEGGCTAPE